MGSWTGCLVPAKYVKMVCGFVFAFALSLFGSVSVAESADTFENESFGEAGKFATKRSLTIG